MFTEWQEWACPIFILLRTMVYRANIVDPIIVHAKINQNHLSCKESWTSDLTSSLTITYIQDITHKAMITDLIFDILYIESTGFRNTATERPIAQQHRNSDAQNKSKFEFL